MFAGENEPPSAKKYSYGHFCADNNICRSTTTRDERPTSADKCDQPNSNPWLHMLSGTIHSAMSYPVGINTVSV
jgi:hypothetical protein